MLNDSFIHELHKYRIIILVLKFYVLKDNLIHGLVQEVNLLINQ